MSQPNSARSRRGIKQEAAELAARRGPGRPPKQPPAPAPTAAPGAGAPPVAPAVAQPPSDQQGAQFGLMVKAMVAPFYLAICGFELPAEAWAEWGIAGGHFAAYYFPNVALHPGAQFASATAMLLVPVALAWPAYAKQRAAQQKAAADAAKRAATGEAPPADNGRPAPTPRPQPGGSVIGNAWERAKDLPPGE
jgi:hypothetical protein